MEILNDIQLEAVEEIDKRLMELYIKLVREYDKAKERQKKPVVYKGETYETLDEANDWYGAGGITASELRHIEDLFEVRNNETKTMQKNNYMKSTLNLLLEAVDEMIFDYKNKEEK